MKTLDLSRQKALKTFPKLHPELEVIDANLTSIADLTPLVGLRRLRSLMLRGTKVRSIEPLAEVRSLEHLWLEKTRLADLGGVERLRKLKLLWLHDTPLTDASLLARVKSLEELDLANVRIDDYSFLAELRKLKTLDLYSTRFDDVALLADLPKLERVRLAKTRVKARSPEVQALAAALAERGGGVSFDTGPHWRLRPFIAVVGQKKAARKSAKRAKSPEVFATGPRTYATVVTRGATVYLATLKSGPRGSEVRVTQQRFKTDGAAEAAADAKRERLAKDHHGKVDAAARRMLMTRLRNVR